MMAAAARISGTTLPAASVRYLGVFASARACAERAAFARAARMRAARARARAVADGLFGAAAAAPASGAAWATGVEMVVAPAPVARRLTPSHRTDRRVRPMKVLLLNTLGFSKKVHRYSSKAAIVAPSKKSFNGLKMDEISFDIY